MIRRLLSGRTGPILSDVAFCVLITAGLLLTALLYLLD